MHINAAIHEIETGGRKLSLQKYAGVMNLQQDRLSCGRSRKVKEGWYHESSGITSPTTESLISQKRRA